MSTPDERGPGDRPRCPAPCGKTRYSRREATDAARRLRRSGQADERMTTAYPAHGAWHVGRQNTAIARAQRRERARRRRELDKFDKDV